MNCKNCDNKLPSDAKFCNKCGKSVEVGKLEKDIVDIEYFSIPPKRLALLSALTLGLYEFFWFYKNWKAIRKAEQQKISPLGRTLLTVFYCHSFFKKVLQSAKRQGYSDSYSPRLLAGVYVGLLLVSGGLSRIENTTFGLNIFLLLITISSFIPLLPIQKAINFNNSKIVQNYNESGKFSRSERFLTVLGIILFGFALLGTFSSLIPDSDISSSNDDSKAELIIETVKEVKAGMIFPNKIDEAITVVDITAEPGAIRYHYLLFGDIDTSSFSNADLKNDQASSICQNKDTRALLDQGINLEYSYVVENTAQSYLVSFTKADCLQ